MLNYFTTGGFHIITYNTLTLNFAEALSLALQPWENKINFFRQGFFVLWMSTRRGVSRHLRNSIGQLSVPLGFFFFFFTMKASLWTILYIYLYIYYILPLPTLLTEKKAVKRLTIEGKIIIDFFFIFYHTSCVYRLASCVVCLLKAAGLIVEIGAILRTGSVQRGCW